MTHHESDILAHIDTDSSLVSKATLVKGCTTVIAELGVGLDLCWEVGTSGVTVSAKLTAFGQSVEIGSATIEPGKSTTLSGHIGSVAKASITINVSSDPLTLCFTAQACAKPFIGSWKCVDSGEHCISI